VSGLFLIAHSVRGEAAFDVATKMECPHCTGRDLNDAHACFDCDSLGYWWIIPTSGHRAFPYDIVEITNLRDLSGNGILDMLETMPSAWPNHYKVNAAPKLDITSLFKANRPHIARRL